ncbi:3-ketoacyl-(acyl-carrier-protein) reductase [Anopheles sinensis]|uniref:3-ketoacyl-(Acyl-carrier-protein) reductase n=1 Tax=Anopheles sinensis TaxID=74873 RepID=A0A084WIK0_ANOSI|nr:3-ketoacyl-(acyl-carrier-protein) reductase [Anopheles sinensis]
MAVKDRDRWSGLTTATVLSTVNAKHHPPPSKSRQVRSGRRLTIRKNETTTVAHRPDRSNVSSRSRQLKMVNGLAVYLLEELRAAAAWAQHLVSKTQVQDVPT